MSSDIFSDEENWKNMFKILIATDNHLRSPVLDMYRKGVWEDGKVRENDSFVTFDEILRMARKLDVDFVLLGGDLFHENKPSRESLVKGLEVLNEHVLGDHPVQFRVVSSPKINFGRSTVNFDSENLNIGLPIFTIHGNHDDPSSEGRLSAVDILSSCGLVNYFGKAMVEGSGSGKVTITPILMEKGTTRVALYGLGHIRDERLGRLIQGSGSVDWIQPENGTDPKMSPWFSIFVLHQNRVQHGANAKNYVQDKHLPDFLDFVLWGHEHECLPNPQESAGGRFNILQPGSSVATALSEGESKRKHVVLLELIGGNWRSTKYPLRTVRPFKFEHVVLSQHPEVCMDRLEILLVFPFDTLMRFLMTYPTTQTPLSVDPNSPESIAPFLEAKVHRLISEAKREAVSEDGEILVEGAVPELPIIRLRVDYTGFSTINTQIFGQKFVGKVANPHDVILWSKTSKKRKADASSKRATMSEALGLDDFHICTLDELISDSLGEKLGVFTEEDLTSALHEFVDKEELGAFSRCYSSSLAEARKKTPPAQDNGQVERDQTGQPGVDQSNDDMNISSPELPSSKNPLEVFEDEDDAMDWFLQKKSPSPDPKLPSTDVSDAKRQRQSPRRAAGGRVTANTRGRKGSKAAGNLDAFVVKRETQGSHAGTQSTQNVRTGDASGAAEEIDDPLERPARQRTKLRSQAMPTAPRKRGARRQVLLDSEDDETPKKKKVSQSRKRLL